MRIGRGEETPDGTWRRGHHLVTFEDGFTFLGEDFGPRYPPVLATARVQDPDRKVLYVGTQGGRVRTAQGRLIVETADAEQILDAPTSHVRRVVAFGSVGVSAGVRSWAMKTGVDVVFASRRGAYQGTLVSSAAGVRAERVRAHSPSAPRRRAWSWAAASSRRRCASRSSSFSVSADVSTATRCGRPRGR